MKKNLCFLLGLSVYFSAFTQSSIINSWANPNIISQNLAVHKMVVAALLYDQGVRREVEDYLVTLYPGIATQSYLLLGDSLITDESAESQRLKNAGYDGILIMKRSGNDNQQQYIPGTSTNRLYHLGRILGVLGWSKID